MVSKGIAVGGSEPWSSHRATDYRQMAAAGAGRIRFDIPWVTVQTNDAPFDWSAIDPVVADARGAGLKILAILHTVPAWANDGTGDYSPPPRLELFEWYCYQTALRYLPLGVTEFELGNEVNLPHPGWVIDADYYVNHLLQPGASGVRRASAELGIAATILMGALAPASDQASPINFLRGVLGGDAGKLFDVVSYHPYTVYPLTDPNMVQVPVDLHSISGKPVWATEYGAPTAGEWSVTEQRQAELVTEAYETWQRFTFAGPLYWYSHRDLGTGPDREEHFGLLRADGSRKPAFSRFKSTTGAFRG